MCALSPSLLLPSDIPWICLCLVPQIPFLRPLGPCSSWCPYHLFPFELGPLLSPTWAWKTWCGHQLLPQAFLGESLLSIVPLPHPWTLPSSTKDPVILSASFPHHELVGQTQCLQCLAQSQAHNRPQGANWSLMGGMWPNRWVLFSLYGVENILK